MAPSLLGLLPVKILNAWVLHQTLRFMLTEFSLMHR